MTPEEFFRAMMPYARRVSERTGLDPRLVLAQSALETGYGKSAPNSNYFGIKGAGQVFPSEEFFDGKMVVEPSEFRAYENPQQSFDDYASFITGNKRYEPVLKAKTLSDQIAAMGASGYATDPNYSAKLSSIANMIGEDILPKGTSMATPFDRAREEELRQQMLATGMAPRTAPRAPLSALRQDRPQAAATPQQRRGGLGGIMDYLGTPSPTTGLSRAEQFAAALDPLIMPEMRAGEAIRARGAQRQAAAKRNKTIEYLEKYSPEAADLMRGGLLNASEALKISRDTEARSLAKRASEALQSGDMQTAMAILTQLSPTAMGQQIAAQAVKPPSEILGGGKYTVTYPEGRSGEPVITINEDVVAAEQRIAQAEREARREATGLPTDARKAEEADFEAITAIDNLMQDISGIIGDFGYDPATKEFTGPLDIGLSGFLKGAFGSIGVGGQGAIETAKARDEFERFKTRLVNTSLRLNKGVQTEGDAQRAAKELGDARTEATAYAAIQELLRINQRARDNRSAAIARRRERFKLDPVEVPEGTAPDLKWSIK